MQLLIGMSMSRYLPAIGTAGFERIFVNGCKRDPRPPPIMIPSTSFIDGIADLHVEGNSHLSIRDRHRRIGIPPLSLNFEDLSQFARHENKGIRQQDPDIDQCKDQIEFHVSSIKPVMQTTSFSFYRVKRAESTRDGEY